jgi:hypothetical protein
MTKLKCENKPGYRKYSIGLTKKGKPAYRCLPEKCKYGNRLSDSYCPDKYGYTPSYITGICPYGMRRYPSRGNKCLSEICKKGGDETGFRFDNGYCQKLKK